MTNVFDNDTDEKTPATILGLRSSALLEIVLFLGVALVIDALIGGGTRFRDVSPHPFWIIVVLAAAQYGTAEGLAAALLSALTLLAFNLPPQDASPNIYDWLYTVAKTPLLWIVAAVTIGELREKHRAEREELRRELTESREREHTIAQAYEWVREGKEKLEARIAGQLRSSVAVYQAARGLEAMAPEQVVQGVGELVTAVLNPEHFSLYSVSANGLSLALTQGWTEDDAYLQRFAASSDLFRAVVNERRMLSISNPEHERILANQGMLAAPLVDRVTQNVKGMLKIEKLAFTDLNLSNVESVAALCEWAGMALGNAERYQLAKSGSLINPEHNLLTRGYFARYSEYITALARRVGFDVTMVIAKLSNANTLSAEVRTEAARALGAEVDRALRVIDLAFDYRDTNEEYSIVLPTTNRKGAEVVVKKIQQALESAQGPLQDAQFSFTVQEMNVK